MEEIPASKGTFPAGFISRSLLPNLGVVIGKLQQPFSGVGGGGRGGGERKKLLVADKYHIPAILDTKSPQIP